MTDYTYKTRGEVTADTNTLAYNCMELITAVKFFIIQALYEKPTQVKGPERALS